MKGSHFHNTRQQFISTKKFWAVLSSLLPICDTPKCHTQGSSALLKHTERLLLPQMLACHSEPEDSRSAPTNPQVLKNHGDC